MEKIEAYLKSLPAGVAVEVIKILATALDRIGGQCGGVDAVAACRVVLATRKKAMEDVITVIERADHELRN